MSTNPKIPENSETLGKISKSLGDSNKSLGDSNKTLGQVSEIPKEIVKTVGKVSELVKNPAAESPEKPKKEVAESPEKPKKTVAESPETPKKKRNQSPRQLANLKKGTVKIDKVESVVPEKIPETPKMAFTFPVKALIVMAFIAGGTLGFFGLWNWWKNQKKSKESPDDIIEVYNDTLPPSQDELNQIAAMENLEN